MSEELQQITKIAGQLPFYSQQALLFSGSYVGNYMSQHVLDKNGLNAESAGMLAASRLQWLLVETRARLSGLFDQNDIVTLLNCFQAEIFSPDMLNRIATTVCEDSGIDVDEWAASPLVNLLETLCGLSPLERVTLADALEQTWYRAGEDGKTHLEVLAELGIEVR
ncbi:hypothetical protein [Ralstonia solanacearum]|uniref:hypothetical protein n=1 Tax=Ralstonia solanacearum TaxID=305 RepID=UPI0005ABC268|nr:hypothetical protein [Ralstonia solanacearum]AMP74827.1 hypothetical protein RALBFv3_11910 [Ralstonia solanacearum]MCL9828033.1 hypothetical protein [Ralstonia solanacearum]MCL9832819.1 hypothetical protein [Ralstonia solanacearum]MCL9837600.1 hypothetical protein [Ralstonia solanacearum]OAI70688.1 hypothetical protein RSP797_14135 [Ralstonia solanacearum]